MIDRRGSDHSSSYFEPSRFLVMSSVVSSGGGGPGGKVICDSNIM